IEPHGSGELVNTKLILVASVMAVSSMACSKKTVVAPPEPVVAQPMAPRLDIEPVRHITISNDHLIVDQKIHFGSDSDVIQDDSFELLDEMASVLKAHREISVLHVVGHTDSTGDDAHNMDLSERRASSVVTMLRDKGVEQTIDAKGAGETQPVCEEDTTECHERNRRVEFIIEKKEG
ncbi:MAG: OmpA family protein, partial [Myxococcota bacterium]